MNIITVTEGHNVTQAEPPRESRWHRQARLDPEFGKILHRRLMPAIENVRSSEVAAIQKKTMRAAFHAVIEDLIDADHDFDIYDLLDMLHSEAAR